MEGFATMYMRMPMSSSVLPIQGRCSVSKNKVMLKFPFTGIEFELPSKVIEEKKDLDFSLQAARGNMTIAIKYLDDLDCYTGRGNLVDETEPVLSFVFFPDDSPMSKLPRE